MVPRARSEIAFFLIFILILSPVTSVSLNASEPADDTGAAGQQTALYTITLFSPRSEEIHSDQIKDQVNARNGDVLLATSFGLSTFNGTWSTRHVNRNNISQGLMDDFITAVEYDHAGNLWIGYSGGIQIFNGVYYQSIRDQQLLKETLIQDLQRWNNDMWVATGHAGIHRYRDGKWTWFQPMTKDGPGFYEIDSMALDSASNSLLIATVYEGLWIVRSPDDPVHFDPIAGKDDASGQMQHVKRDPLGGVYFYNPSAIVHFDNVSGFHEILTTRDLTLEQISINDITAGSDGSLYIATDDGMYIWCDGALYRHLNRFEGMGTSEVVRTINVDAKNRVWFATQGHVGYYLDNTYPGDRVPIELVTTVPTTVPVTSVKDTPAPAVQPVVTVTTPSPDSASLMNIFAQITDPITRAISVVAKKFGVNIFS